MHIALVRHGKPAGARNPVVGAAGFARWVRDYERSRVRCDSIPPRALSNAFDDYLVVSSGRPRSVHSAEICLGRGPDLRLTDLREMEIPRYRLPLRMPAYAWLYLSRAIWIAGLRGRVESFREANARAVGVALELHRLAQVHRRVVVFGHGLLNRQVASRLRRLGWRGEPRQTDYWGVIHLDKPTG